MTMTKKDVIPRPAAMIVRTGRAVVIMVVMVVVMPVMDVTGMNMFVRHRSSLAGHTEKVV